MIYADAVKTFAPHLPVENWDCPGGLFRCKRCQLVYCGHMLIRHARQCLAAAEVARSWEKAAAARRAKRGASL